MKTENRLYIRYSLCSFFFTNTERRTGVPLTGAGASPDTCRTPERGCAGFGWDRAELLPSSYFPPLLAPLCLTLRDTCTWRAQSEGGIRCKGISCIPAFSWHNDK